jgi:hypothetical protein
MRFREFARPLNEDPFDDLGDFGDIDDHHEGAIEDEAESRGDSALVEVLELLRSEAADTNAVTPRVAVDTVIERVRRIPGFESFNYAALDAAIKSNDTVKNLVKGPPKDDQHTGDKYLYLTPFENTVDDSEGEGGGGGDADKSANVVSGMAKRALGK